MKVKQILVPLDGSENSFRSLQYALDLAKQCGASVIGLHVFTDLSGFEAAHPLIIKEEKWPTNVRHLMEDARKVAGKQAKISYKEIVIGGKSEGNDIVTFADSKSNHIDLIVMGHKGMSLPKEIILGSTAHFVLHKSQTPVLIIK